MFFLLFVPAGVALCFDLLTIVYYTDFVLSILFWKNLKIFLGGMRLIGSTAFVYRIFR
nr:MAG TPA: hypothetical protein [Bacteriophage sp.]